MLRLATVFIKPCQHICRSYLQLAERDIRQLKFQHEPLDFNLPTLLFNFINLVTAESIKKKYEKHEKQLQNSTSYQKDRINVDHITDEESVIFGKSQSQISYIMNNTTNKLKAQFVDKFLGSTAWNRDRITQETPRWITDAVPNARCLIDTTYLYIQKTKDFSIQKTKDFSIQKTKDFSIQKTKDFSIQKKTYSMHKSRNLVKMHCSLATNGKWTDSIGPFFADGNNNDEWIYNQETITTDSETNKIFDSALDIIVADRGYIPLAKNN
ncbi:unnamed protein product [Didymodactylos carnosus]|uniref:Uncharacterized protein n=1 Tax=Didymodactylos carnosus TaxID=1234261 RepID=A0A8S2HRJ7_9BILA|nr:unnamed protein product [Didymodactylos carnosus]CAF3674760.1 unnamed protein product [Didymodactylos carnosus]